MTTSTGFRVRRGVPERIRLDGGRPTLSINAMADDPLTATIGVTDAAGGALHDVVVGDTLPVGTRTARVVAIVPGERGAVEFAWVDG